MQSHNGADVAAANDDIRVLLVDDHPLLRAALRALLANERDLLVVGEAANGSAALAQTMLLRPDVIVMDLSAPGSDGTDAIRQLKQQGIGGQVVVLTMHFDDETLLPALEAGAAGFVRKTAAAYELATVIRSAARGEGYPIPQDIKMHNATRERPAADGTKPGLSEREREVLTRTVEGFTSIEIGERLGISPKTVDTYRSRVFEKLKIEHRSELVRYALDHGLLCVGAH